MSRFSMAVVALVWFLPVTHANTVLPFDDECVSAECALNALQARALAVSGPSKQNASDSTIPGLLDPDISDVLPDPDGDSSESGPDEEVSDPSGSGLCSGEAYDRSKEGCCAGTLYDRISEGCCNGDIYDVEHEDCCGGKESYDTRTQGCCNDEQVFDLGQEYLVFGLQCLAPVEPQEDKIPWNCTKEWPPSNYASVWKRYCATKSEDSHMAWAMTPSCQVGWLSVKQTSKSAAEQNALEQCQSRATAYNQETCHIFDLDGKLCARQRCGSKLHDATMIGCCNGQVFDSRTQDCCSGRIYNTETTGCCKGRLFKKEPRRCCGDKILFNSNTHGCCLEDGPQIFRFGSQNCCASPKGTCRIPAGITTCCRKEGNWRLPWSTASQLFHWICRGMIRPPLATNLWDKILFQVHILCCVTRHHLWRWLHRIWHSCSNDACAAFCQAKCMKAFGRAQMQLAEHLPWL